jgi:SAM-dependent methyltransferase
MLSAHAQQQAALWGTDAEGWSLYGEPHNEPLFRAVLAAASTAAGRRLLDVGCGTGMALQLAAADGWTVSGVDVAEPLLDVARRRVGGEAVRLAEADDLPFDDGAFDAVIGINAFQFAADPVTALSEAARVLAPRGRVVASLFAEPERSESTAVHESISALVAAAAPSPSAHAPYLLSAPGNLERALSAAGLEVVDAGETVCVWAYPDTDAAVRGILSSAGGAGAADAVGRDAVAGAVRAAVGRFTALDGRVSMRNTFRWVAAEPKEE